MIEVEGCTVDGEPIHECIEWNYPNIYNDHSTLRVELCHTRATDGIRIKYDSGRDGWIIEQDSMVERDGHSEFDNDWQEVAFVKAWGRERREDA